MFSLKNLTTLVFAAGLIFSGGSVLSAQPGAITAETIQALVTKYVHSQVSTPPETVRINFTGRVNDIKLPASIVDHSGLTYQISTSNDAFIGDANFVIRIHHQGQLLREERLPAKLEIAQDVVVSNRALPKGAILSEEDVVLVKKWIRNKSFNHVTSLEEVLGKRLTAGIPYKAELKKNMIAERIYIKKGMNVRIVLNSDSISITALGVSEQDGTLGEIIKVRNISSNRAIFARVLNESVVEVEQ